MDRKGFQFTNISDKKKDETSLTFDHKKDEPDHHFCSIHKRLAEK